MLLISTWLVVFQFWASSYCQADLFPDSDKDVIEKKYLGDELEHGHARRVNFTIEGDTSSLFKEEDFEKKFVSLLYKSNETLNTSNSTSSSSSSSQTQSQHIRSSVYKCLKSNRTSLNSNDSSSSAIISNNTVKLVNGSLLSSLLSSSLPTKCILVLFYVPWCPFSAQLAPIYNALPRAFLDLDFLAFDVSASFGYNTKFGTNAVPMIALFQNKNVITKYNYTEKNLTYFMDFLATHTGLDFNESTTMLPSDFDGPVPSTVTEKFDTYLFLCWLFLIVTSVDLLIRKTKLKQIIAQWIHKLLNSNRQLSLLEGQRRPMITSEASPINHHEHVD